MSDETRHEQSSPVRLSAERFALGLAWHDIGKPFALATAEHTRLGHRLLVLVGRPREAEIALLHGASSIETARGPIRGLGQGQRLPAAGLLANPLDRLAASAYSLFTRQLPLGDFKRDGEPVFHSWQNAFTRLPRVVHGLGLAEGDEQRFTVRESNLPDQVVPANRRDALDLVLWSDLGAALRQSEDPEVRRLGQTIGDLTPSEASKVLADAEAMAPGPSAAVLRRLEGYQRQYPERTYPPANDTSLGEHTRLSAALGFALFRSPELRSSIWRDAELVEKGDTIVLEAKGHDDRPLGQVFETNDDGLTEPELAVAQGLRPQLVRVSFDALREWWSRAARVDDLLGAKALTTLVMDAFEASLATALECELLLDSALADDRRLLLTLVRGQFDLLLLLPRLENEEGLDSTGDVLSCAFEQAVERVAEGLMPLLRDDFRDAVRSGALEFGEEEQQSLRDQLLGLGYRHHIHAVECHTEPGDGFEDYALALGRGLIEGMRLCLEMALVPDAQRQSWLSIDAGKMDFDPAGETGETCEVCSTHEVFAAFDDLLESPEHGSSVSKATHSFRGVAERPCISCIARRILSHGVVAGEAEGTLAGMLAFEAPEGEGPPRTLVARERPGAPSLPPMLVRRATFRDDADYLDLGVAYARYHRAGDGVRYDRPQVFPTVSYAADRHGNVVMLTLAPGPELISAYDYSRALKKIAAEGLPEELRKGARLPEGDIEHWQASFGNLHRWLGKQGHDQLAGTMGVVEPHLARVMERIRAIQAYYGDLKKALDEAEIRVLPLDVRYPSFRVMLPATSLMPALRALERCTMRQLLSIEPGHAQAGEMLHLAAPTLLTGTILLFKHKHPLYLALDAERTLHAGLAARREDSSTHELTDEPARHGVWMAMSDLRGSLGDQVTPHAEIGLPALGRLLDIVSRVDRRSVSIRAGVAAHQSPELADALIRIRADRHYLEVADAHALEEQATMAAVQFLKRATRDPGSA